MLFRNTSLYTLALACLTLTLAFACSNDDDTNPNEDVNNRLDGDWEVESFTRDGTEQMNFTLQSFDMEFTKQGPEDGETEWTLVDIFGGTTNIEGDYSIENNGTEIDVDGDDLDLEIDGDDLEIRGNVDGELWIITAERD